MFSKFDERAQKVLVYMKKEMSMLKHPYVGSEHLLLSLLKYGEDSDIKKLESYEITYKIFRDELISLVGIGKESNDFYLYTPLLKNIIESASESAYDKGYDLVTCNDLLLALFEEGEGIAIRILLGLDIDVDKVYDSFCNGKNKAKKASKLLADTFGVDLTEKAKNGELDPVIGRDKEIRRLLEILFRRTKNNPLLIGEAGVGKTAIVEELARMITSDNIEKLKNKRIISISMANLVAGTKYRGEFEERIGKLLKELEDSDNIILFIDEIHTLVGAGGAEGAIDASNILKPALARGKIKIIGATTSSEYKEFIANDKALERRFQTIEVQEPNKEVVNQILLKLRPIYESYHNVTIKDEILDKIIELSEKYIYNRKMPDKVIDILDEVCAKVSLSHDKHSKKIELLNSEFVMVKNLKNTSIINNNFDEAFTYKKQEMFLEDKINKLELKRVKSNSKEVTIKDVKEVIEAKTKIPIFDKNNDLKNFKEILSSSVIGQNQAIEVLYKFTKKIRYGNKKDKKPYSYLFVGPTGTGKTLLAKEYTKLIYQESNLIRLDMSEYKEPHTISKLIGSPPGYVGYSDNKNVFELVKDKPYAVILLDEIEKASHNVLNLFLQILDEGEAKDSKGNTVRFDNTTIIMTSNIGCNNVDIGFNDNKLDNIDESLKNILGVEILNRLDSVIYFDKLNEDSVNEIIDIKIKALKKYYKDQNISIRVSKTIKEEIKKLSKYEIYGARKIDKVISEYLENIIIDKIIDNQDKINIYSL